MKKLHALLVALCGLTLTAQAHFVWLERDTTGAVAAYFGEWTDNVRETQDGYLKILRAQKAFAADGTELPVHVRADRLAVPSAAATGDIRLSCVYVPEKGTTLSQYHARLGRADTRSQLPLELVPVAPDSNTFTVTLRGQPLPGASVTLFTSAGWNRTFKTDAHGRVQLETPWPGPAVLEVTHTEKSASEHDGRAYEAIRHVATLMFDVPAR